MSRVTGWFSKSDFCGLHSSGLADLRKTIFFDDMRFFSRFTVSMIQLRIVTSNFPKCTSDVRLILDFPTVKDNNKTFDFERQISVFASGLVCKKVIGMYYTRNNKVYFHITFLQKIEISSCGCSRNAVPCTCGTRYPFL